MYIVQEDLMKLPETIRKGDDDRHLLKQAMCLENRNAG